MKQLRVGALVAIKYWWGEHFGVVGAHGGQLTLISNSRERNGVTEEYLQALVDGKEWRVCDPLSTLAPDAVIARARSIVGRRYDFWDWNCEDFVHWAFGIKPRSRQRDVVAQALTIVCLLGVVAAAVRAR